MDTINTNTDSKESLVLKNPSEVYYEMWKNARNKAKEAKKASLAFYLEAKRIKEDYMLDILESDTESDIEEDSEEESSVLA